ncbi:oxidoreductase [Streptomyces armeniacus]|uniref:Oxidoreductase n=1 Tax=Streptomyces armeniacus TaxID=83291 RepID=A0A345XXT0_9ACTN|nr:FMN reductase [Streptomyces armeniacus]AXK36446.1 oxidoreductase [Streptomyces armeniacus]
MQQPLKIVVVTAGLSEPSSTRLLADRLAEATARHVATEVRTVELRGLATAIAHNLVTGFPGAELREALDAVAEADALIAVTPVFTGSYSGLFKSFFDVLDNTALIGKPVLIGATGGTARHSLVLDHALRPLFAYLRALTVPTAVYAASEDWGSGGDARTGGLAERIERAGEELAGLVRRTGTAERTEAAGRTAGPGRTDAEVPGLEDELVPFEEQLAALRV